MGSMMAVQAGADHHAEHVRAAPTHHALHSDHHPGAASHAPEVLGLLHLGHGDAPGTSRLGTREVDDLCALIAQVTGGRTEQEAHVGESACSSERVVLFGWSLGAGISIAAAAREPRGVVRVIAEAPYRIAITPARNVLRGMGLPRGFSTRVAFWLLGLDFGVGPSWRGFDRAALASRLRVPLLVIHGDMDDVCPVEDARAINEAASRGEIVEVRGAGHHSLWTTPTMTDQFLARALAALHSTSNDTSSAGSSRD
jgi:pimeloyl-ACP methyl ester carboxylesterase